MSKLQGFGTLSRMRLWLSVLLAIALFVLSVTAQKFFGYRFLFEAEWVTIGLGIAAFVLVFVRMLRLALAESKLRRPAQAWLSLVGLVILLGLAAWQEFVTVAPHDYWWQLGLVAAVLLIADWLTLRARGKALGAMPNLMQLLPEFADVLDGQEINRVPIDELRVGDVVLVRPGARVPGDGVVVQGEAKVDESEITGDIVAALKSAGHKVLAGSVNVSSRKANHALTVRIDAVDSDLLLASVLRRVASLSTEPVKREDTAVVWSSIGSLFVVAVALLGSGLWLVLRPSDWTDAVACFVAVLVGSNVSSAASSLPIAKILSNIVLARNGILPRSRNAIMNTRKSHIAVFSLAGTLNLGAPKLVAVHLARNTSFGSADQVLALAAATEVRSEHSLAEVITREAEERNLELPDLYEIEPHPLGVSARYDGSAVLVGGPGLLTMHEVPIDVNDLVRVAAANERGNTIVYVVVDSLLVGYLEFANEIRQTAKEVVRALQLQRKRVVMLTGESTGVAEAVAKQLGITEVFAEIPQDRKVAVLEKLREDTSIIVMVGDSLDDAPTLAIAEVGIALGVGADIAAESADVSVITPEPRAIAKLIEVAKRYSAVSTQNLFIGLLLNVATFGLAGWLAMPALGACVLAASTFLIMANTLRLARAGS